MDQSGDRKQSAHEFGPLPGGHHGLSRQQIADSQRERLLASLAHQVAAHGYRATTITEVAKSASVSTRDFYQHFEGIEECFLTAFDAVSDYLEEQIATAIAAEDDWPHRVIAALRVALAFFAAEPDLVRLILIEPLRATATIALRFRQAVLACVPAMADGRHQPPYGLDLPPNMEDQLLGGIIALAAQAVLAGETEQLPGLLPDLTEFALSSYLGAERAAQLADEAGHLASRPPRSS